MKITISGIIIEQGVDSLYEKEAELSLSIDNNAKMFLAVDGETVFISDCLEIKNAIDAFNI
jgi:hypothetical protein